VYNGFKKESKLILKVLTALQELFITVLLPNRKLLLLEQQRPELLVRCRDKNGEQLLLYLYFEDCIKRRYSDLVKTLARLTLDNVKFIRDRTLNITFNLFYERPEQETLLLAIIINKLGDPEKKIASKTGFLIVCMLTENSKIDIVVINELTKIILRPNIGQRTRFNAITLLNRLPVYLKISDIELNRKLLQIYFTILKLFMSIESSDKRYKYIRPACEQSLSYQYGSRENSIKTVGMVKKSEKTRKA